MRKSPPTMQQTITTISTVAVNTHIKTCLEFCGMAHINVWPRNPAVTHDQCTESQKIQMNTWKTNDIWVMSWRMLKDLNKTTWWSQVYVNSRFAFITHEHLASWTRYKEKQNLCKSHMHWNKTSRAEMHAACSVAHAKKTEAQWEPFHMEVALWPLQTSTELDKIIVSLGKRLYTPLIWKSSLLALPMASGERAVILFPGEQAH